MRRGSLVCLLWVLLATPEGVFAQATGSIEGTVLDVTNAAPLPGVTVSIPGTPIGSLTGADGAFVLAGVPAGEHEVAVQVIGYAQQTLSVQVTAGEATSVTFELESQAIELEGIVAVGYGTQNVRDVTGSISSVSSEQVRQIATPNVVEAMKGRSAGVDVVTSGFEPGDGVRVRVRGTRSMQADDEPLYVVDGIPVFGGIQDFNPSDIQSIEILKDASATAIYGSRGANGVVLITTNRGDATTGTRITYDTYYGFQAAREEVDMMGGQEFARLKREANRTVGKYPCPEGTDMSVGCAEGDQEIFKTAAELASIESGEWTNWQDLIQRQGNQQNHAINVSGGNESTRFTVSGNYFDQQGITRGQDFNRATGSASIDHQFRRMTVGLSANVTYSVRNRGAGTSDSTGGNGVWNQALRHNPLGLAENQDGTLNPQPVPDGLLWNPVLTIDNEFLEQTRTRFFGSIWAEVDLAEGIRFRSNFGPDLTHRRDGEFAGSNGAANRGSGNANANLFRDQRLAYTWSNFLTIDRQFGETSTMLASGAGGGATGAPHRVNMTLLYELQKADSSGNQTWVSQLPYEHQRWNNLGTAGLVEEVNSGFKEWLLQSYMARINYSFLDRYMVTLTGRMDGSSRLADGNKYGFFPSVAVAWRLGDEAFMRDLGVFNDLKLRASYGLTANTAIDPYQTQGELERTTSSFNGLGAFGFRPTALDNPSLEWEKTRSLDVGADFAILNGRVSGTADFYIQNTYDLLLERQLPITSGYESVLENIGETRNSGVELSLSTVNIENPDGLTWTTDIAWARNRNEIVSLYGTNEDDVGNNWFIGQPIDAYYDYEFAGIWQSDDADLAAGFGQEPGDIKVVDQNGDGQITGDDRVVIGRHERHPSWTGSLNNRFQWGRFDLSALAIARWGYTLDSAFHDQYNTLFARYNNINTNYWTPENPTNEDPRPNVDQERPQYNDSRQYKDGSHVRIRSITLGYIVPDAVVARIGGESLRIYATAQDPYVFTDYEGFDPESNRSGGTGAGSPAYRTLLIGASIGF